MTYSAAFRCDDGGGPHWLDTSLTPEVWAQIAKPSEALCTPCIDKRAVAKGITFEAEFYWIGQAGQSRLYGPRPERRRWVRAIDRTAEAIIAALAVLGVVTLLRGWLS